MCERSFAISNPFIRNTVHRLQPTQRLTTACDCCRVPAGIKPVYVFEGKPPELKMAQLRQRRERREEATEGLAAAKEAGDQEAIEKYGKRTIKVRAVGAVGLMR